MRIELRVNGVPRVLDVPPLTRLLDALRGPLGLTGTKEGCGEGECGSCTVLLDGEPVNACLAAIGQCHGRELVTVEGLSARGELTTLQRLLEQHGGLQCGICTPGVLLSAQALLDRYQSPNEPDVRGALSGNLCRCTGYQRIVEGVMAAAEARHPAGHREEDPR